MSSTIITEQPKRTSYSNSKLSTYKRCPTLFRFHYIERLMPRQAGNRHDLDYGSAMHEALAVLYTASSGAIKAAQQAFIEAYPIERYPDPLPKWSLGKTQANGIAAIASYARRWREEDQYWNILHVEQLVTEEGDDAKTVRLDLIVEDQRDGQIWAVDHKVTGKYLDGNYWSNFEPDSQIRSYVQHVRDRFGDCGGFIINAITLKHRSKAYTPRTGPEKGIQQPAGDWHAFARMAFNPNTECLQLETDNIAYWIGRIKADTAANQWGYNTQECHRGGIECEYYPICSAGWSWPMDEELILSHYRQQCPAVLDAGRCQLDLNHEGDCDPTLPAVDGDYEVDMSEEIEEAAVE